LVGEADFPLVSQYTWCVQPCRCNGGVNFYTYARSTVPRIFMHRLLLGFGPGDPEVDHANHNGLDNRRSNLRPCSPSQNQANKTLTPKRPKSSIFRGVTWVRARRRWQASIQVEGKSLFLGQFDNEEDAARAYNDAARAHFGEFATINDLEVAA